MELALEECARLGLAASQQGEGYRGAKYTLSALMHMFSVPAMAQAVGARALQPLAGALLVQLLDQRNACIGEGGHLQKGANVLMMKIVSQADQCVPSFPACSMNAGCYEKNCICFHCSCCFVPDSFLGFVYSFS